MNDYLQDAFNVDGIEVLFEAFVTPVKAILGFDIGSLGGADAIYNASSTLYLFFFMERDIKNNGVAVGHVFYMISLGGFIKFKFEIASLVPDGQGIYVVEVTYQGTYDV